MKNIFKLSFLALFMLAASSEDAIDIIQEGELSEEAAYRTVDDLQSGLNGVYATYTPDSGSNGDGDAVYINDILTDDLKRGTNNSGQGVDEYNYILLPTTPTVNTIWTNRYTVINRANRVLRNIDRILEGASQNDIARGEHIRAQLFALRALSHFDLLQYYAPDPQDPASVGVIRMDFVPDLGDVFPRNTVGEVFELIKADLAAASELISPAATDTFYITPDALLAITARVLMYEGNPSNYAQIEAIAEDLLSRHALITDPEEYVSFWADGNLGAVTEDIWTLFRGQEPFDAIADLYFANTTDEAGSPILQMSNQLYESYPEDDYRIVPSVFIDETSDTGGPDRDLYINKYPGSERGQLANHYKIFRASEMVLIKAEAEARQNKLGEAAATVYTLKAARNTEGDDIDTFTYASVNAALTDILGERRRELCFEGHRYVDLKRIGRELNIGVSRNSFDCASFGGSVCDLGTTSHFWALPIPRVETSANNDIEQNPGY